MTFRKFMVKAFEYASAHPKQRLGQAYFNVLHKYRPDLSEKVRSGSLDPFYRDQRVPNFLAFVAKNW